MTWPDALVNIQQSLTPLGYDGSMATFVSNTAAPLHGESAGSWGAEQTSGTTGLTTAELYDPTSGTWSATGSMAHGRRLHTMTQLRSSSNSTTSAKVLAAGGIAGTTSLTNSAELYSVSAGTWTAGGKLDAARHDHTATLLVDGRVIVAGGLNGTTILHDSGDL